MMVLLTLAQAAGRLSRLYEAATLMVVGMLVVFGALCLTAGAIALLNRCLGGQEEPESQPGSNAPGSKAQQDAHLRVVLAAAASVAVGRAVRVDKIVPVKG